MNKKLIILDIICYAVIPYFAWKYGREPLGDYIAILLSTVPGFIYTVYRFTKERQFNITGLFIISSLLLSTTINLLSSSAESMLWNQVYIGYGFAVFHLITVIFKRPMALYFAVDMAYLQGYPRKGSKALFNRKGLFIWFQLMSLLFVFRGIFQNSLKAWLIGMYGADGYDQVIIYMNVSGWIFSGLIMIGYFFISNKIMLYTGQKKATVQDSSIKKV
jgi:hypothetical protein